ncbi:MULTISPECIES: HK97 family phage prohead protease [unclassified Roseitalea]|uniref:HK97 family phage prohead protease n=1 Tax=unclassified Roseitalea TaxID=2639107 RepID=UPI00273DF6D2|nr:MULTISPECIES: HK97 family phage prohead protease [unclassified Roseitalea]
MTNAPPAADPIEHKFAGTELETVSETGVFSGYASLFDTVDLGREAVVPGAFARSLAQKGAAGIRMLFQHNPDEPIGHWIEIAEDARGLKVRGRINTAVARGREVLALMRAGGLDGLSIGFRTVRGKTDPATGIRRIIEADLWEISIVTFPMLPQARISAVKRAAALPTRRDFERWLVRDAGLTRRQARIVISKGFAALDGAREAAASETSAGLMLAETIRRAARHLHPH